MSENKKLKPIKICNLHDGIKKAYWFENNYGAWGIKHSGSYGSSAGKWELAVIFGDNYETSELCYTTEITNDVIGWLDENEVEEILYKIKALK